MAPPRGSNVFDLGPGFGSWDGVLFIGVGIHNATRYMRAYGGGTILQKSLSFLIVSIAQYMQCCLLRRKGAVGFLEVLSL